jgi:predicted transcriptional regulator
MKSNQKDQQYLTTAKKKIGEAIAFAIKERGYTKDRLAQESGVSKTIIYKVLRGQNYEINAIVRIMRVLQMHLEMSLMSADNNVHTMTGNKPPKN